MSSLLSNGSGRKALCTTATPFSTFEMIKNKQQQKWNNFWGNFSQLLSNAGVHWWQEGEERTL